MQQLYEEHFSVFIDKPLKDWDAGEIIRHAIEDKRNLIVKRMDADGANQRHYLFTIYELPKQGASYRFHLTAERHPEHIIEYIEGAGSNETSTPWNTGTV